MNFDDNDLWFVEWFTLNPSKRSAERVAKKCRMALTEAGIFHKIKSNTIEKTKLAAELKAREFARGRPYRLQRGVIEADVIDLANVWVYVYLPQYKAQVRNIITTAFNIRADIGEELEGTDVCTEYYWVSVEGEEDEEEEQRRPARLVEIQVVTDTGDREFQAQHELDAFLHSWAEIKGRKGNDCGDSTLLWEVLEILDLRQHREIRDIVLGLDMSTELASDFSRRADGFVPLKLSLAMYVTDEIMRSPRGRNKMLRIANVERGSLVSNHDRYQMRVLRDTFIWLAHLYPWGEGTGSMLFHGLDIPMARRQRTRILWLDSLSAIKFFQGEQHSLSLGEGKELARLWAMFEGHTQLPALYAFNLARLDVKGPTPPNWAYFHRAITGLVYDRPQDALIVDDGGVGE